MNIPVIKHMFPNSEIPNHKALSAHEGFRFAMPAFLITRPDYCWACQFLKVWNRRVSGPSWQRIKLGMVFNLTTGEALSNAEVAAATIQPMSLNTESRTPITSHLNGGVLASASCVVRSTP